jgi:(p)ppGpp synthase/HD superfamily hydrolase
MTPIEEVMRDIVSLHEGQVRKGTGVPYAVHPIMVMNKIAEWGITEYDMQAAALLHDVLEDTIYTNVIAHKDRYGERPMEIVEELTFSGNTYDKMVYLDSFADKEQKSVEALVVKVADRICNVRDFMVTDFHYAGKYCQKAGSLFNAVDHRRSEISGRFGERPLQLMFREMDRLRRDIVNGNI